MRTQESPIGANWLTIGASVFAVSACLFAAGYAFDATVRPFEGLVPVTGNAPSSLKSAPEAKFRMMSFNIRRDFKSDGLNQWKNRIPLVTKILQTESPDIIGMQEVLPEQMDDIKTMIPEYEVIGAGRDDGQREGEFVPLFFRKDKFKAISAGFFWLSDRPDIPGSIYPGAGCTRITTWALLRMNEDSDVGVDILAISTHFDHVSESARKKGAEVLRLKIREILDQHAPKSRGTGIVLVGDFNAEPEESALHTLLGDTWQKDKAVFYDSRLKSEKFAQPDGQNVGTFPSWDPTINGKIIDYVLYTPSPLACFKENQQPSDAKSALKMLSRESVECLKYTLKRNSNMDIKAQTYSVVIDPNLLKSPTQPSDHRPVVVDFRIVGGPGSGSGGQEMMSTRNSNSST